MEAAAVFRQGLGQGFGPMIPFHPGALPVQHSRKYPIPRKAGDHDDVDNNSNRIAHTLTACCRCRQRKTRCDPTLPRCLPCERSGSICEYFDTAKGKKISRLYVISLQDKVRALEAELGLYTGEDDMPRNTEDIVRPGGLVRLNESDETPRYLGPSSGIAMTRILMEEAKRYTDSKRISDLIPQVRVRKQGTRAQSIAFGPSARTKSYPMISAHPAQTLPTRQIADRLVVVFCERAQIFTPTLHEKEFLRVLEEVYANTTDPYSNFIVRMVLAISLQKLDLQYAGLADSYYLAAMGYFEDIIRPKDWKTLQCLVLIGQYSLLTPTRTAVYYIIGLATRICQELGLDSEKTIITGVSYGIVDPLTLDMKRRMAWAVASMEFGLAHSMGRPNGFAKGNDLMDVQFFDTVPDENITEQGIKPGPPSEKKLVSIHFCKMRLLQAEIRRMLYEKKRAEPRDENHPWFGDIERKLQEWVNTAPENPAWCKPWFTGRYHSMLIFLYRPSPQVPQPSSGAARRCFDSSSHVINLSSQQMIKAAVDITWVFLLTLFMSVNALLWSVSYSAVRTEHSKEEVEELINTALEIMDQCVERWPGTASAAQLYPIFAKACLHSYDIQDDTPMLAPSDANSPAPSDASCRIKREPTSPPQGQPQHQPQHQHQHQQLHQQQQPHQQHQQQQSQQQQLFTPPQFGYVFGESPGQMNPNVQFDDAFPSGPTFRSNSIFLNPATTDQNGRRFSYFPPDEMTDGPVGQTRTGPPLNHQTTAPSPLAHSFPSPPDSIEQHSASTMSTPTPMNHSSPANTIRTTPTPTMASVNLASVNTTPTQPVPHRTPHTQSAMPQRTPAFTIPPLPQHHAPQQRPLPPPTDVMDWFSPPPPFISPYAFSNVSSNFLGAQFPQGGVVGANGPPGTQYAFPPERQGSLSADQQMELMGVLEDEGLGDIDTFLNTGMGLAGGGVDGGLTMQGWG